MPDEDKGELGARVFEWAMSCGLNPEFREGSPDLAADINHLLRTSEADYLFLCSDDRLLFTYLNLTSGLVALERYPKIACIVYSMTAGSELTFSYFGKFGNFLLPSHSSVWRFGDCQILFPKSFRDRFGYYQEGLKHGEAEWKKDNEMLSTHVTTLLYQHECFDHIGVIRSDGQELP